MRKNIISIIALVLLSFIELSAKELPVIYHDWGIEISNVTNKGKKILKSENTIIQLYRNNISDGYFSSPLQFCFYFYRTGEQLNESQILEKYKNGELEFINSVRLQGGYTVDLSACDRIYLLPNHGRIKSVEIENNGNLLIRVTGIDITENLYELHQKELAGLTNEFNIYQAEYQSGIRIPYGKFFDSFYKDMINDKASKYVELPDKLFENTDYLFDFENDGDGVIIYKYKGKENQKVTIPNEIEGMPVTKIASWGKHVDEIVIPSSVKVIGKKAFFCCGIKNVSFEQGSKLISVGEKAFAFNNLSTIDLPRNNLVKGNIFIDKFAYFMNPIKEISVPKLWSFKCSGVFYSYEEVKNTFIEGVHNQEFHGGNTMLSAVSNTYFYGMGLPLLEKVVFEEGVEVISEYMFCKSPNLMSVKLPSTLKTVGQGVFEDCFNLKDIIVPESLKDVKTSSNGTHCFKNCKLELGTIMKLLKAGFPRNALE